MGLSIIPQDVAKATIQTDKTQFTKITDGTNDATVKAASTPAVAADPAIVVAISPNNPIAVTGTVTTSLQANVATQFIVSVTNVSTLILAANANRKGFILSNIGGNNLFVSFGTAPTTSLYQVALPTSIPNEKFEQMNTVYTGDIFAIRASGTTNVSITEFT